MRYGMLGLALSPRPRAVLAVRYPPDRAPGGVRLRVRSTPIVSILTLNNVTYHARELRSRQGAVHAFVSHSIHTVSASTKTACVILLLGDTERGFYALIVDFDHNVAKGDPA